MRLPCSEVVSLPVVPGLTVARRSFAKAARPSYPSVINHPRTLMLRLALALLLLATTAQAATLDRIREAGVLRCGGVPRAGLAAPGPNGMTGLEVDLCRALAAAVLGDPARIEFHPYVLNQDFDRLRRGEDAVAFLTGSELLGNGLLDAVVPGPAVFHQTNGVMVPAGNPAQHLADLAGTMVCAEPGTGPERTLLAWFRSRGLPLRFSGWQEQEEMLDAFDVGRCPAVALDTTALAAERAAADPGHPIRILPEPLSASPVLAVTGLDDARWAAVVGWTVQTLQQADARALPVPGAGLGLAPDWQARVLAGGTLADLVTRHLGGSLKLPAGMEAAWQNGGLVMPAAAE